MYLDGRAVPQLERGAGILGGADLRAGGQILTGGGPQGTTNLIMVDIYERAFTYDDQAGAAVETIVLVAAVLLTVLAQFRLMRGAA